MVAVRSRQSVGSIWPRFGLLNGVHLSYLGRRVRRMMQRFGVHLSYLMRRVRRMMQRFAFDSYQHMAGGRLIPWRVRSIPPVSPLRPSSRRMIPSSFEIDIDSCTSFAGFSYRTGGWNPHVATLGEFIADPSLRYEDSSLFRLYEAFMPETLQQLFLEDVEQPMRPLSWLPPLRDLFRYVWTLNPALIRSVGAAEPREELRGHHYFGPMSPERGRAQFERTLDVFRSIQKDGFLPDRYGPVGGYFLADESSYRFVVSPGNHRLAVLKVLGHTSVRVGLRPGHPGVIHRSELASWTVEQGGPFEQLTAHTLFEKLMSEDGLNKARRIGVVGPRPEAAPVSP